MGEENSMEKGNGDKRTQAYLKLVERLSPRSRIAQGTFRAFWVGGVICIIGQLISDIYSNWFLLGVQACATAVSITLIAIAAFLTGIGVYDRIGKYAGAGSIVPITGFANSIVSPAMEFRREGFVLGVGGKMFQIAGPVLVYGISAGVFCGLISWFFTCVLQAG